MADKCPETLEDLRALPKTSDPVELCKRRKWKRQIEKRMEQDKQRARGSINQSGEDDKKGNDINMEGNGSNSNLNKVVDEKDQNQDINTVVVNEDKGKGKSKSKSVGVGTKRNRNNFEEDDHEDVIVRSDGIVEPLSGAGRQEFTGVVAGPDGAVNAITQKWVNGQIDDKTYGDLLSKLDKTKNIANGGLKPMEFKSRKRRKISHNGGSIVCDSVFIFFLFSLFFSFYFIFLFLFMFYSFFLK